MSDNQPTDLELLAMRAEALADRSIGIRFDRTQNMEEAFEVASIVPPHLVAPLESTRNTSRHGGDPTSKPSLLGECERLLTVEGWNVRVGKVNLVYVIPHGVSFASNVAMHRSDRAIPSWLRQANPGNWEAVEWDELIAGSLGPWVMAALEKASGIHPSSVLLREPIPPIETKRLRLESMSIAFLSAVLTGDLARAQQHVDHRVPRDFSLFNKLRSVEHRLRLIQADASQHPWMYRAIVRKEDGELLGHVSFHHKAPDPDLRCHGETGAELAYTIEPAHRRRGYAKESAIGMMEWASGQFGVRSFVLTISPRNLPSLKTAASMGFVVIGEQHDPVDGRELVMRVQIDAISASKRGPSMPSSGGG